ncbi:hypothetical protein HOR97_gp28 [Agrobacterium phage Atu_ph03]|uniref:Uncharacterized protein n=2 Tax=Atuphduovirus TaxID=2731928 RepID=A0A2L0UYW8_9CAUD|nr:hypothetical protein HOR96_gp25 [Agrobacterium phage Atu_ph02]YP_009791869.1 hypothetical protein HOR97_gp28 [Agrobacterium phage Atu_ph03]AUZ94742.1 hypothetical protein [Agrobacterium phage Atu_ph02]AUZ94784.1 hypothetical protein [Agrobacterium phage Atu_ph03]
MCFKVKTPAQETQAPIPAPAPAVATPEAAGVLVKGASTGGSRINSSDGGDDVSQKRRRRSASQGLGL